MKDMKDMKDAKDKFAWLILGLFVGHKSMIVWHIGYIITICVFAILWLNGVHSICDIH